MTVQDSLTSKFSGYKSQTSGMMGYRGSLSEKFKGYSGVSTGTGGYRESLMQKFTPGATDFESMPEWLKDGVGFFRTALDYLSRPLYASAGAAKALVKGENVLEEAWKGFSGEERETYSDVFTEMGWEPTSTVGKVLKGVVSFGTDVLLDPTTYLGIGVLTKGGRVAKGAGSLSRTLAGQAAKGERALLSVAGRSLLPKAVDETALKAIGKAGMYLRETAPVVSPTIQKIGKAMSTKFRPKGISVDDWVVLRDGIIEAQNLKRLKEKDAFDFAVGIESQIQKLITGGKVARKEVDELLSKIEAKRMNIPKDLQPLHRKLVQYSDDVYQRRTKLGLKSLDSDKAYNYWIHTLTEAEKKQLSKSGIDFSSSNILRTKTGSDIARKYVKYEDNILRLDTGEVFQSGQVIEKIPPAILKNADWRKTTVQQATIDEINQGMGRKIFETDIPTTAFIMGRRIGNSEAANQLVNTVRTLGIKDTVAPAGYKAVEGIKDLKGLKFNPVMAEEIGSVMKHYTQDESITAFGKMYDTIQNTWKGAATFVNPAFHSRNAISNVWQNFIGGVKNPKSYVEAGKTMMMRKRGFKMKIGEVDDVYREFQKQGLGGVGWFGADIKASMQKEIKKRGLRKALPWNFGKAVGSTIEDHAKLSHFIDKLKKGYKPKEAAKSVRKYLFDYEDLTQLEKTVFKRIAPFYTWTRKNVPLQIQELFQNPGKFGVLAKGITELEKATPGATDFESMPEWLKDGVAVKLFGDDKKTTYINLEGFIPSADIQMLSPSEFLDRTFSMITPIVKAPLEQYLNYNTFFKKEIEEYEKQPKEFMRLITEPMGKELRGKWVHLLSQFRPASEIDKLMKREYNPITKRYEEPSMLQLRNRLINWLVGGKTYTIHKDIAKARKEKEISSQRAKLKSEIKWLKKSGRFEAAEQVRQLLNQYKD